MMQHSSVDYRKIWTAAELISVAHGNSVTKGFWPELTDLEKYLAEYDGISAAGLQAKINLNQRLMLIMTEVYECHAELDANNSFYIDDKSAPCGFSIEFADAVIRLADLIGALWTTHDITGEMYTLQVRYQSEVSPGTIAFAVSSRINWDTMKLHDQGQGLALLGYGIALACEADRTGLGVHKLLELLLSVILASTPMLHLMLSVKTQYNQSRPVKHGKRY